ncbi:MAG TPA: radical SAM/SPASM family putative metalloenzyme maturase [Thermodesulfovibrionales bacterium]|nr:radical SAM/SPASM family putative metalloenzyme maturase [Thermodesulfovibrionales bacterium]
MSDRGTLDTTCDSVSDIATMPADSAAEKMYPSKLFVEVTTRCNLACGMCVKQAGGDKTVDGDLPPETFYSLEPAFPHLDTLILNGIGEPLLHPHLEAFIAKAKEKLPQTAWVGFQTNGLLLTDERAVSLVDAGLDRICLSLDAASPERFRDIRMGGEIGDMERAFSALQKAKTRRSRHDLRIGMEFVLMRDNLFELPRAVRWAAEQGVSFAIVTQVLPYSREASSHAVYDTNTAAAIAIYREWKRKAETEGITIGEYFEVFMKYAKSSREERLCEIVEGMKAEAGSRGITLHIEELLSRDEDRLARAQDILEETALIANQQGITIKLPELAPDNKRRCEFVETGSAFVSRDGNVQPCYFLWHRYACYVGGREKRVKPWNFGNLSEKDIIEIWNEPEYRAFRKSVLHYDFPFCFDCSFALCDYVQDEDFEQDCYVSSVPCGACLWCTSLFHCLL